MSTIATDNLPTRPPSGDVITRWLRGPWPVALLLGGFLLLGVSAAEQKSPTFDEPAYITGGYSYWKYGDYRLHPENGNWSQRWGALPVWLSGRNFPATNDANWVRGGLWELTDDFFYHRRNNARAMMRLGRWMQTIPAAALALIVYLWSRKLFGPAGGLISLTLCVCSPTILGYAFYVTAEIGVTLFLLAATWGMWTVLHRVTVANLTLAGFALSGAALTKFSGLAILPIAGVLVCARLANPEPWIIDVRGAGEVRGRAAQLLWMAGLGLLLTLFVVFIIWASFGFRYSTFAPSDPNAARLQLPWETLELGGGVKQALLEFAREKKLLPEAYLYGLWHVLATTQSRVSFLNGALSVTGFRSFFAVCLALKTPLTLFLLLLLAAIGALTRPGGSLQGATAPSRWRGFYELVPVLALLGIYAAFAFSSNLNIGHRLIMPLYPPLFILAGGAAVWFRAGDVAAAQKKEENAPVNAPVASVNRSGRIARAVILGALAFTLAQSVWVWPNYTAYFNIFAGGGRNAHRHLVDSSLDWGQDLGGLIAWLDNRAEAKDHARVYVSYFGSVDPWHLGFRARLLPAFSTWRPGDSYPYTGGLYCISATSLESVYNLFPGRWNQEYESQYQRQRPVAIAYRNAQKDVDAIDSFKRQYGEQKLNELLIEYEYLRFGRLCAFLRAREPDDDIGRSILIFRLTDDEVRQALEGPPPAETLERPET